MVLADNYFVLGHMQMTSLLRSSIASSVRSLVREAFPDDYCSLCQVHAVVGANVASIVLEREYRPVAGLAMVDCGGGQFIRMVDNAAFSNPAGGSYHCWIESVDEDPEAKEYVDFTFGGNRQYAAKNGFQWQGALPAKYLWGLYREVTVNTTLEDVPPGFGKNKIWVQETLEGYHWMAQHVTEHSNAYVDLTAKALKIFYKTAPKGFAASQAARLVQRPARIHSAIQAGI